MKIKVSTRPDYQKRLKNLVDFLQKEEVKVYTMAILSFFTLSFFILFAIKPTLETLFSLRRQISDFRKVDKKLEEKINALLYAQEEYQKYQANISLINKAIPNDSQFTSLVRKIENLGQEYEATISALRIEGFDFLNNKEIEKKKSDLKNKENLPKGIKSFNFSLTIFADYQKSDLFLRRLMNLRRIIALKRLEISTQEVAKNNVKLILRGKAFYLP